MELEKNTKDELRNLINVPKLEIADKTIENITSILNKDPIFSGIIKPDRSERALAFSVDLETLDLSYNIEQLKRDVEWKYQQQSLFDLTLDDYYRYYLVHGLFHEVDHIDQINESIHDLYPYQDLNNIYRIALAEYRRTGFLDYLRYLRHHENFFYERNADINASKLAMEIFDDLKMLLYAANLHSNVLFRRVYSKKGKKIISPVEQTMKYLRRKMPILQDSIPFDIALEHGLPITPEEYHYIFDYVDEIMRGSKQMESQEINERMQKMILAREESFKNK